MMRERSITRNSVAGRLLVVSMALLCTLALLVAGGSRIAAANAQTTELTEASVGSATTLKAGGITISKQPLNQSVTVGSVAEFSVVVTGTVLKYQWQYKSPSATEWANSTQSGADSWKLKVTTNVYHNGYQYRCVLTDGNGNRLCTNTVKLTVRPKITSHPKNVIVAAGSVAKFTVAANGKATLKYQWQYKAPGETTWTNSTQSGSKTATLSVTTNINHHGYQYRCVVKDGNGQQSYSNAATITLKLQIKTNPKDASATVGSKATFTVAAVGKGTLTYQWQCKSPSATEWTNSTQSGAKTAKLSVSVNANHNGYQYRCEVTDSTGESVYSTAASITVLSKITSQPVNVSVRAGTTATFSVTATGKSLKYQWQCKSPTATEWTNSTQSGAKTAKLSVKTNINHNGYRYRCVVTDANGKKLYSSAATITVSKALINATDVTLYALSEGMKDALTIPAGKHQSFQLVAGGTNATFKVDSGSSCTVDETGLIQIRVVATTVYNLTTRETRIENRIQYGDSVVKCLIDGETCYVNVHVVDYSVTYADELIAQYLRDNINDNMTDLQKMEAIARYPATFDYDYRYSGYVSMLVYGGGDCWASTSLIIRECEMLGIEAWSRNGNKDYGAGSGHRNAMAYYNGTYYELEAGYSGTAPRLYNVTVRTSLYSYRQLSDGTLSVYQYDAHTVGDKLVIPSTINGKTVKVIEKNFFPTFSGTEVVIPDTCEEIGDFAFSGCSNLQKVNLPAGLKTLGTGTFAQAVNVTFTLSSSNPYLALKDNCVYSKDYKTLYWASAISGVVTLPSTVEKITGYAFYHNVNVTKIVIPESVTEIGEGAFGNCSKLEMISFQGSGLKKIGPFVFAYTNALSEVVLPTSLQELDQYAFYYAGTLNVILTSMRAPAWNGEDITGEAYENISFYVPVGSKGYDTGKWAEFNVTYGKPST